MKITRDIWTKALLLHEHSKRNNEKLSRVKLTEIMQISDRMAGDLIFAIENKHIIRFNPVDIECKDDREIVFNDVHIPFQDDLAVSAVLDFARDYKPTIITINGDLIDFYQVSKFSKDPSRKKVYQEIKQAKEFLVNLRNEHPDAQIHFKEGNHEQRLTRFIMDSAKEIYELIENLIQEKLKLSELDIKYHIKPFRIGKLWHLHGHEKPGGSYNPEYITNVMWKYIHDHFIVAHYHRNQNKTFKKITGENFWGGAVGYLAGELDYAILNNWTQGFATIDYAKDGNFKAKIFDIWEGKIL